MATRLLGGRKKHVYEKPRFDLTPTGLLMEGDYTSLRCFFAFFDVNECNRDLSPIAPLLPVR
jgi:hypothetical protein